MRILGRRIRNTQQSFAASFVKTQQHYQRRWKHHLKTRIALSFSGIYLPFHAINYLIDSFRESYHLKQTAEIALDEARDSLDDVSNKFKCALFAGQDQLVGRVLTRMGKIDSELTSGIRRELDFHDYPTRRYSLSRFSLWTGILGSLGFYLATSLLGYYKEVDAHQAELLARSRGEIPEYPNQDLRPLFVCDSNALMAGLRSYGNNVDIVQGSYLLPIELRGNVFPKRLGFFVDGKRVPFVCYPQPEIYICDLYNIPPRLSQRIDVYATDSAGKRHRISNKDDSPLEIKTLGEDRAECEK